MNGYKIKVIGIGGIGGCLLPILLRFLAFSVPKESRVTLIDGDSYETKNRDRQEFNDFGNKALVSRRRLESGYHAEGDCLMIITSVEEYITSRNASALIREGDIVFLCVDNHATRKVVSDRCAELNTVCLISGGNDLTDGNVQIFIRLQGENKTLPLASAYHPEIEYPQDTPPDELGCEEAMESSPQILITNNAVAATMLNAFLGFLQGKLPYDEVYLDVLTNNTRSVRRS